jgi:hypothetical protein
MKNFEKFESPIEKVINKINNELSPEQKTDMISINRELDQLHIKGENRDEIAMKIADYYHKKNRYDSFSKLVPSELAKQARRNEFLRRDHLLEN